VVERASEPSYSERLLALGVDVTQLCVDSDGTIAPRPASERAALDHLPRLFFDDETEGPASLVIGELLGEGGRGVVRRVYDPAVGRHVAVKLTVPGAPKSAALELLREARIAGRLAHPNIVPVYALGRREDGRPALLMKQIVGTRWADQLLDRERDLSEHLGILVQVCNAVAFAHKKGVVHRDLKPSNIMVGEFGEVYVLDWGLAVTLEDEPDGLLARAADVVDIAGTPGYMAPEMASAEGARIDTRTDVYLLGGILHELLTGRAPHQFKSVREALVASFKSAAPKFDASVPDELASICRRALQREPAERFQDVVSFRDAINAYLKHHASRALQQEALGRVAGFERLLHEPEELHKLAIEARFGFRQALREWPDNAEARIGLERLLERMAEWELERENRDGARALVGEMSNPSPELVARLARLETALAERHARLTRLERDADPKLQARERTRLSLLLTATVGVLCFLLAILAQLRATLVYAGLLSSHVVLLLILGAAWLRIRHEPGYALSRRFAGSIAITIVALVIYLTAASLTATPLEQTFPVLMLLIATSCSVGAITIHRGFINTTVVYLAAFTAMQVWPSLLFVLFGLTHVLGFGSMAAIWMRADSR